MPQKNKNEDGLKRTINDVEITDPLVFRVWGNPHKT